jgi:hypothetical protein
MFGNGAGGDQTTVIGPTHRFNIGPLQFSIKDPANALGIGGQRENDGKQPRPRRSQPPARFDSGEFDAGPRDYGMILAARLRTRHAYGRRLRRPDDHDHARTAGGW